MAPKVSDAALLQLRVLITMRIEHFPTGTIAKSLTDLYRTYQQGSSKRKIGKRIKTKLIANREGLFLKSGSWWSNDPNVADIVYSQIEQYSICTGRPQKIILLVTSKDGMKTECVVIKTRGTSQAIEIVQILRQMEIGRSRQRAISPRPQSQTISYKFEDIASKSATHLNKSEGNLMGNNSPKTNLVNEVTMPTKLGYNVVPISELDDFVNAIPSQQGRESHFIKKSEIDNDNLVSGRECYEKKNSHQSAGIDNFNHTSRLSRSDLHPLSTSKKAIWKNYASISYQDKSPATAKKALNPKRSEINQQRRRQAKIKIPRIPTDLEDPLSPWEVNISLIKNDPVMGCVEDENGPIYMYTAHQIVPRTETEREICGSQKGCEDSSSGSDCDYGSDSTGFNDENELERFIMEGRQNVVNRKRCTYTKVSDIQK